MKLYTPKIYSIAHTKLDNNNLNKVLTNEYNVNWDTNTNNDTNKLIEFAGKTCYLSFDKSLNPNLSKIRTNNNEIYIKNIIDQKHFSVLEHGNVTFSLNNVSLVMTHELVRHRHMSYSQTSNRYVRHNEIKMSIFTEPNEEEIKILSELNGLYKQVLNKNIKTNQNHNQLKTITSKIRRYLPNGIVTNIIVTCNHRCLREVIEKRVSKYAEIEIQYIFSLILLDMVKRYETIYFDLYNNKKEIMYECFQHFIDLKNKYKNYL